MRTFFYWLKIKNLINELLTSFSTFFFYFTLFRDVSLLISFNLFELNTTIWINLLRNLVMMMKFFFFPTRQQLRYKKKKRRRTTVKRRSEKKNFREKLCECLNIYIFSLTWIASQKEDTSWDKYFGYSFVIFSLLTAYTFEFVKFYDILWRVISQKKKKYTTDKIVISSFCLLRV